MTKPVIKHRNIQCTYLYSFVTTRPHKQEGRSDPWSDIFIHGKAASIGCLAMGDEAIEELLVITAQLGAENVKVVIAPHNPRAGNSEDKSSR